MGLALNISTLDLTQMYKLSPREMQIFGMLVDKDDLSLKEIGARLKIDHNTVTAHKTNIQLKLRIEGSRTALVRWAIRNGLAEA